MVEQCRPYLAFEEDSLQKAMQDQETLLRLLKKDYEVTNAKSGWGKGDIIDSYEEASMAIKMGGSRWRSPGETWQPESLGSTKEERTSKLGVTNEEIHPCVFYRMQQLNKRPPALEKFKRQACKDPKNGWEWVKKADGKDGEQGKMIVLPEYRILPKDTAADAPPNIERQLAELNGAGDYLKMLDDMYNTGVDKTKPDSGFTTLAV